MTALPPDHSRPAEAVPVSTAHRLWRLLPTGLRRRGLAIATAHFAPRPDACPPPPVLGLAVGGELSRATGLGEGGRLMLQAAARLGLPTWAVDIPPPVDARAEVEVADDGPPPPGVPLVLHVNGPLLPLALLRLPRRLLRRRTVIGYWAWEMTSVPPEWQVGTRFVHEVWTPSRFTASALERLLPGRVRAVPPPLAMVQPARRGPGRDAFALPADAVVVLVSFNLGSSLVRKNPFGAIAAFRQAFGDRPDRILVLKVGHADHAPADLAELSAAARAPNIRLDTRMLSTADHQALIAASDIVLSLHRSEGLGLVPAEAMLLGKPVVATGWSGNMEYMDASSAALVRYRMTVPDDPRHVYHGSAWADPDLRHAAEQLRRLADDVDWRHDLGRRGQVMARLRLGVAPLAEALRDLGLPVA